MFVTTLIAATVAAQPAPIPRPSASPAPTAEKKMACCDKMAKGQGCECCTGMERKDKAGTEPAHGQHGGRHQ